MSNSRLLSLVQTKLFKKRYSKHHQIFHGLIFKKNCSQCFHFKGQKLVLFSTLRFSPVKDTSQFFPYILHKYKKSSNISYKLLILDNLLVLIFVQLTKIQITGQIVIMTIMYQIPHTSLYSKLHLVWMLLNNYTCTIESELY